QVPGIPLLGRRFIHDGYGQPRAFIQLPLLLCRLKPVDRLVYYDATQIGLGMLYLASFFIPSFKRILPDILRLLDVTQYVIGERDQEWPVLMNGFVHVRKLSIQQKRAIVSACGAFFGYPSYKSLLNL